MTSPIAVNHPTKPRTLRRRRPSSPPATSSLTLQSNPPITCWYKRRKLIARPKLASDSDDSIAISAILNDNSKSNDLETKAAISAAVSDGSCVDTVSDAHFGRNPISFSELSLKPQISAVVSGEKAEDGVGVEGESCDEVSMSQFEAEIFSSLRSSDDDFTGSYYSSSLFDSSSGEWSFEGDGGGGDPPSETFSMFQKLAEEFVKSEFGAEAETETKFSMEFAKMRFVEEEDEESYMLFRSREMKEVVVHDYGAEYSCMNDYGGLIMDQRLMMVQWMIEHASAMELQCETLFLGVSLLDRFLSRGYFKSERNLQMLGIACITLATRIEENQPYNSIRQIAFKVGDIYYKRCEVVAMEWLVQKVLKFKCFVPTIHNFLWFYLKAAQADACIQTLSRYLAVLSLLDHQRLSFRPSSTAAGLVILACLAADCDNSSHVVMASLQWLVEYAF